MTLQEALRSGRNFRRRSEAIAADGTWLSPTYNEFDRDDILADDWEIEEPTVTITRSQLATAYWDVTREQLLCGGPNYIDPVERLAKQLGLEP